MLLFCAVPFFGISQGFNTVKFKKEVPEVELKKIEAKDSLFFDSTTMEKPDSSNLRKKLVSLPLDSLKVTSLFGMRTDPFNGREKFHRGIDFSARQDSVKSILPGVIEKVGNDRKLGIFVRIDHGIYTSVYGHLSTYFVGEKQVVKAGETIGITGSTGRSTGEHLHFSMKYNKDYIDPLPFLLEIEELLNIK